MKRPLFDRAREIVRSLIENDELISVMALQKKYGISRTVFEPAVAAEKARLEVLREIDAKIKKDGFNLTAEKRLYFALKRQEASFEQRVVNAAQQHLDEIVYPSYFKEVENAREIVANRQIFSNKEYMTIIRSLHPDSSNAENRAEAFLLVKKQEHRLRPPERERQAIKSFPTIEEIRRRADALKAEDAAKREAARAKAAETRARKVKENGNV
jgi:hypothetical protein